MTISSFTSRISHAGASALLAFALSGCALHKSMTTQVPTDFLRSSNTPVTSRLPGLPFAHSWQDPKIDGNRYSHLTIHPVSLRYLRKDKWQSSISSVLHSRNDYMKHADELAAYWNKSLARAFRSPANRLQTSGNGPACGTLVADLAITEIVFSHPDTYTLSWSVPGGVLAEGIMLAPCVAFEAVVRDAATGKVMFTAADRRGTKLKLFDIHRLTITKPNREICDEWSQQLMQSLNRGKFPIVERTWIGVF